MELSVYKTVTQQNQLHLHPLPPSIFPGSGHLAYRPRPWASCLHCPDRLGSVIHSDSGKAAYVHAKLRFQPKAEEIPSINMPRSDMKGD